MVEDKYIGLALAVSSSLAIGMSGLLSTNSRQASWIQLTPDFPGTSTVITKKVVTPMDNSRELDANQCL
jgi:hypothetical protein